MKMTPAEEKNAILRYALSTDGATGPVTLRKEVLPHRSNQEIISYLEQMATNNPAVARINTMASGQNIVKNGFTLEFLDAGGFVEAGEKQKMRDKKERLEYKLARWQVVVFWPVFLFGIASAGYAGYDFFFRTPKFEDELKSYAKTMDEMKSEIKELRLKMKSVSIPYKEPRK